MCKKSISKQNKIKSLKHVTILLAFCVFLIWVIAFLIDCFVLNMMNEESVHHKILKSVVSSALGVLPAIIIFNFVYEYLTKEIVAEQISKHICDTLMGTPETLNSFKSSVRKKFISATLASLLGKQHGKVIYNSIEKYLGNDFLIREHYLNVIVLSDNLNKFSGFTDEYYYIQENVSYKKYFTGMNSLKAKLGFFIDDAELDEKFKDRTFLLRESLNLSKSDFNALVNDQSRLNSFVNDEMQVSLAINGQKAEIDQLQIDDSGIIIIFKGADVSKDVDTSKDLDTFEDMDASKDGTSINVSFWMPQLKTENKIFVSFQEPTYKPRIFFTYPKDTFGVTILPFLNSEYYSKHALYFDGICNVSVDDWIYPVSGVVFMWSEKTA